MVVNRGVGANGSRAFHRVDFKQLNRISVVAVKTAKKACDLVVVNSVVNSMGCVSGVTGKYKLNVFILAYNPFKQGLRRIVTIVAVVINASVGVKV